MSELHIYTDGGARGNPGPAGIGAVLFDAENNKMAEVSKYIGVATNNVAEYIAVIYGLHEALFLKANKIVLHVDSQLVARQLSGTYRVKNGNLKKYFGIIQSLFKGFEQIDIQEVPREENSTADKLVNKAINLNSVL